jgi:hypothetical protein
MKSAAINYQQIAEMIYNLSQQDKEKLFDVLKKKQGIAIAVAKPKRVFGAAKGKFWMSDNFDAPLEDFKEYI